MTLWLDPLSYHLEGDRLFDAANTPTSGDRILEPFVLLRRKLAALGVEVHTGDLLADGLLAPAALNLYATMGTTSRFTRLARRNDTVLSAFFVNECPIVEPRMFDALPEASRVFRRLYSYAGDAAMAEFAGSGLSFRPFRYPYPFDDVDEDAWGATDRGFLAIINGNKVPRLKTRELYTERMRGVEYFARFDEIDLYGVGWDGPPFRVGETWVPRPLRRIGYRAESLWGRLCPDRNLLLAASRRVYRGAVASKAETLARYRFALCFENMNLEGWVTEKLFDCLRAGAVPVYLGAPDIERWVDPACFIDMRWFAGYDDLRTFLHGLSPAEIDAYRQAGRSYLRSEQFDPFRGKTFADSIVGIVREDAGITA